MESHSKTVKKSRSPPRKTAKLTKRQRAELGKKIKLRLKKKLSPKLSTEKPIKQTATSLSSRTSESLSESSKMSITKSKSGEKSKRLNEELIGMLEEMTEILTKQGEHFRSGRYKQAMETVMMTPDDITSVSQLKGKKGVGPTILSKMEEFEKTGTVKFLERERKNPAILLTNVYGVGYKGAKKLVDKGITTISQLKDQQEDVLNDVQKKGLRFYDDIMKRIPRDEIEEYADILEKVFSEVKNPGSKFEIVGSYRRGKSNSGDIDIIITDEGNDREVFVKFMDALIEKGILLEILSRGKTKSLTIGKIGDKPARRLDFLYSPPSEYAFSVLYFTGSKTFNTFMRRRALELGYSLNEHGFYKMSKGKKGDKIDMQFPDEESIFDFIKMEYREPEKRVDGRDVTVTEKSKKPSPVPEEGEGEADGEADGPFKVSPKFVTEVEKSPTESIPKSPPPKPTKLKIPKSKVRTLKRRKGKTASDNIATFTKQGEAFLKTLTEKELSKMVETANAAYYNETPLMEDNQFDIVKEFTERKFPQNKIVKEIGAPVEKNKVELPYFMGSMDKIKPDTKALGNWKRKYSGQYVLSGKLDGISGLYTTDKGEPRLYTRGNGRVGQDISYLIPYLRLPKDEGMAIRGEIIVSKKTFTKKYADTKANARNFVAGVVNAKTVDPQQYRDISFVAYEIIQPEMKPSEQFSTLEKLDIETVINMSKSDITNELLSDTLVEWRESYEYETDGVIVTDDKVYERTDKNPPQSFAFKMVLSEQVVEAKVVDVLWTASKHGHLKPRIKIEPVNIGGAMIEYATAFNAKYVEENKLGIGSIVKLVRSGDVIPHIMEVIKSAPQAKMPDVPYEWDETRVNITLTGAEEDRTVREKIIGAFFKKMDVVGLGPGNVTRLYDAGFDSVPKILAMEPDDYLTVDGFKQKTADKLYGSIRKKVMDAKSPKALANIMAGSNLFGRGVGERKITAIFKVYPDILTSGEDDDVKVQMITENVEGFASKTAKQFVKNIPLFLEFMKEANLLDKLDDYTSPVAGKKLKSVTQSENGEQGEESQHELFEKAIVMTGFRDKELIEQLEQIGAKISGSVSGKTFAVIVPDAETETGKTEKAESLGIPVLSVDDFKKKYM